MATEQQRKEKEQYDARTFPEIYMSLSRIQQSELRDNIIRLTGASRVAVYFWSIGRTIPQRSADRQAVSESIKKVLHIMVPPHILFNIKK